MKHLGKLLVVLMTALNLSSYAQNDNNKWAVSFGVNAIDTRASAGGEGNWLDNHFSQPFQVAKNWNIMPPISYVNVFRYIGSNLSVGLEGSFNRIDKYVRYVPITNDYVVSDPGDGDLMYYGANLSLKYSFEKLINSKIIDPSLRVGVGYNFMGDTGFSNATVGVGLTFWFTKTMGLFLETGYKGSFEEREDANGNPHAPSYFQHVIGLTFRFLGKDTDKDGVLDVDDDCPNTPGLKEFSGCPDSDGDGIPDILDDCPNIPGIKKFRGCPDTDGDGIPDAKDDCPRQPGPAALKGCPDKDGDGIVDKNDKCPNVAGLKEFDGCPDTDGDGVPDKSDDCPKEFGLADLKGCPDRDCDGVADKDDKCPDVAGSINNDGCAEKPVIAPAVRTTRRSAAKAPVASTVKVPVASAVKAPDKSAKAPTASAVKALDTLAVKAPDTLAVKAPDKLAKAPAASAAKAPAASAVKAPVASAVKAPDTSAVKALDTSAVKATDTSAVKKIPEPLVEFNMKAGDDVLFFDFGKTNLGKGSETALYVLAIGIQEIIKDYPDIVFTVGGHTDNIGTEEVNLRISRERADVVRNALIERGVNPNNMISKGYGYSQPVATNQTDEGRAKNRRTEIKYINSEIEGKM